MKEKLILHEDPRSGNCYKIRLTAALLGLPLERRHYDVIRGDTRTREFLASVNSNGRIPVLQIGAGDSAGAPHGSGARFLPESNAACFYLAEGSALIPAGRFERADMLRWMFFEQYYHEPNIATLRFWLTFVGEGHLTPFQKSQIPAKRTAGEDALAHMDAHLAMHDWLVGDAISIADISLYAYTHVCEAGGFRLRDRAAICAWLKRVQAQRGYVAMD